MTLLDRLQTLALWVCCLVLLLLLVGFTFVLVRYRGQRAEDLPDPAAISPDPLREEDTADLEAIFKEDRTANVPNREFWRHQLSEGVMDGLPLGENVIVLTQRRVVCLSPDAKVRWSEPFAND
jgi:hypothetical protein